MSKKMLSVIILTWNSEDYIEECLMKYYRKCSKNDVFGKIEIKQMEI